MTLIDFIAFFLSILLLIRGASRGFMNSLIVPFSIIVATIISIIYFQITHEVITSLALGLISPLLLYLLLKFLLKKWATASYTVIHPNFLSRLGGAILTLIWGWAFIVFALILLAVLPPWGKTLADLHDDVHNSASYIYIARPLGENFFTTYSSADAKSLALDPRFQETLRDPDIQKEIDARDIVKLMSNPKMINLTRQVLGDPATMKKLLALYSSQPHPQAANNP